MQRKHGFTLVELSIVIVIMALIIAGVSAGKSMVKQYQLNKVLSDFNKYAVAINTFKLQYNYYPGDLKGSLYWSGANDGDQDGDVVSSGGVGEEFYAWEHLRKSKLIPGNYNGIGDTAGDFRPGYNVPKGAVKGTGTYGSGVTFNYTMGINLSLSGSRNNGALTPALSPVDAKNLDVKVDDGFPNRGKYIASDARMLAHGNDNWYEAECTNPKSKTSGSWGYVSYSYGISYQTTSIERCLIKMIF